MLSHLDSQYMAAIIPFTSTNRRPEVEASAAEPHNYSINISAFPNGYLEFTANGVRTDAKALYQIAAELEKIASIIRSDVITKINQVQ